MINTASYFEPAHHHGRLVSVSLTAPKWFAVDAHLPFLAPPRTLLEEYKRNGDVADYKAGYKRSLISQWARVEDWLNRLDPERHETLLCYEKAGEFCHRNLIFELVKKFRPDCLGEQDSEFCLGMGVLAWNGFTWKPAIYLGSGLDNRHLVKSGIGVIMTPNPLLVKRVPNG